MQATTTLLSILRVITSSMRGNSMTTLAGGPREPRAWKLASVVRGGAVGKGLYSSTSLAAYSTLGARELIWCGSACSTRRERRPAQHREHPAHRVSRRA